MNLSSKAKSTVLTVLALSIGFVIVGIVCIEGWEFSNSNTFCAKVCHNVHPEEPYAHQASQHAQVTCVECHMGRQSTLKVMAIKITHTKHLWYLMTGYERPLTSPSMPASRNSCEGCHSDQPHQHDSVLVRKHYEHDKENTETTIQLTLRAVGGYARDLGGQGINWHIDKGNKVRFIATDEQNQNIPWVETTHPDGKTVVYTDITQPLTNETIVQSEKKVMDCMECHNRVGHPFLNPEVIADKALAQGYLNSSFPFIKDRLMNLLQQDYASEEEALNLVKEAYDKYEQDFPDIPREYPEDFAKFKEFIGERQKGIANWMVRSKFRHPEVSWQSFQDLSGHRYTPGCFRCHGGKHLDQEGNRLPVNCTTCHDVPLVKQEQDQPAKHENPFGYFKPLSHQQTDFIVKHRTLDDQSCRTCHGEIEHGTDNKSFCANAACHATEWPGLDLDAK